MRRRLTSLLFGGNVLAVESRMILRLWHGNEGLRAAGVWATIHSDRICEVRDHRRL